MMDRCGLAVEFQEDWYLVSKVVVVELYAATLL